VAADAGVALVPASAHKFQRGRVVYRPLHPSAETLETAMAWRRDDETAMLTDFISSARDTLAKRTQSSPHVRPRDPRRAVGTQPAHVS
jgi:hypothetical protein